MKGSTIFFALLFPILLFLSFNKHSKDKVNTYHSVIWADAAGYYIYLPITFLYEGKASDLPRDIVKKTGNGFKTDPFGNNKVFTKYPSGTAILQAPFFLAGHFLASPMGYSPNGFSWIYHASIMVAGVFYGWLGCLLLFQVLKRRFKFDQLQAILTLLILLLGSHLYYYMIQEPGMSHVYSFFLFALLIHLVLYHSRYSIPLLFAIGGISGLILITRPSNIVFLGFLLVAFPHEGNPLSNLKEWWIRKYIIPIFFGALICIIPQLLYWEWLSGDLIMYSYGNEGFSNFTSPQIHKVLFSTNNGLFIYTPLFIFILIGMGTMIKKRVPHGVFFLVLFILITYIVASWWSWTFGCSYGSRNYVEYLAPFSIPLAYFLFQKRKAYQNGLIAFLLLLFIYMNMDIIYYYDGCFHGGDWDFSSYLELY